MWALLYLMQLFFPAEAFSPKWPMLQLICFAACVTCT